MEKRNIKRFKSGSVRTTDADDHRFDLVSPFGLFRLAKIYAEGAKKYGDRNWELGQPFSEVLNHAERHLYMWKKGDRSEDHLAKVAWGMFAIMHYEETLPTERREHERCKVKNLKGTLIKKDKEKPNEQPDIHSDSAVR